MPVTFMPLIKNTLITQAIRTYRLPQTQLRTMADQTSNPTLIGGHAQYVKGVAEAAVGSVTGSKEWQNSGETDKSAGIDAMKQASANRDPQTDGFGKTEELAGKAFGCEGMEKEGAQSKQ